MKISLNWIRDYVALDAEPAEIARAITFLGFEVEQIQTTGAPRLDKVVVGEVLTREKHPNADKLSVCTVNVGTAGGVKTIVCGAQNYKVGDRVPVALPGAVLPGNFTIRQSKIRGQSSDGMLCSGREIGVGDDAGGLLILTARPEPGTPINDALPRGDTVLDVEITPNRPDCLSHLGLARELAAWFRKGLVYPVEKFRGDPGPVRRPDLLASVRVDVPEDCPLYTAHLIAGVTVGPSPAWLQERLRAVGLRPVNNVVDVGNYVMLEYGQPLHAFDAARIAGGKIVVRRAGDGEKIVTLDGKERMLASPMLVIADEAKPLVVAGILGGTDSGVEASTTAIVLECAVFRAQSVRRTARALGLSTDSSHRYERGVDPHLAIEAAWRAVDLILETAGGTVVGPVHTCGGDIPWKREITVRSSFICERLGFEIPASEMREAFESLELSVGREVTLPGGGLEWTVGIPSWRDDLDRPIDLVEEVLRLHGTERIPPGRVTGPGLVADDDPIAAYNRRATEYLVGHDFHECVNLTLRSATEAAAWMSSTAASELALDNPFVADQSHLRPSLVPGLLDTLRLNRARGVAVSRLGETGRVFAEHAGQNFESVSAAFVIAEDPERRWLQREPADFYEARHHVAALAAAAGVDLGQSSVGDVAEAGRGWQRGHSAQSGALGRGWVARFGLLDLSLLRSLGIQGRVFAGEFFILPAGLQSGRTRPRHADASPFPAALRDLALVVGGAERAGDVLATLARIARASLEAPASAAPTPNPAATPNPNPAPTGEAASGKPAFGLESVEIFDVYQGKGLPEGAKSLAFSLVFRSPTRTLTDDEVNAAFLRIQEAVAAGTPYVIRR